MSSTDEVTEKVNHLSLNDDNASSTVFNSTENYSVLHPLSHRWTLWYIKPPVTGKEQWHELLKEVVTVSTVEEFWGAYNLIPKVMELPLRSDYAFFRDGIRPEWEDNANQKGGKWLYQIKDKKSIPVDDVWLKLLLGIIGGTLDNDDHEIINGAFINVRRAATKVNIWTSISHPDMLKPVGSKFKDILSLGNRDEIEFTSHDSHKSKNKITM